MRHADASVRVSVPFFSVCVVLCVERRAVVSVLRIMFKEAGIDRDRGSDRDRDRNRDSDTRLYSNVYTPSLWTVQYHCILAGPTSALDKPRHTTRSLRTIRSVPSTALHRRAG